MVESESKRAIALLAMLGMAAGGGYLAYRTSQRIKEILTTLTNPGQAIISALTTVTPNFGTVLDWVPAPATLGKAIADAIPVPTTTTMISPTPPETQSQLDVIWDVVKRPIGLLPATDLTQSPGAIVDTTEKVVPTTDQSSAPVLDPWQALVAWISQPATVTAAQPQQVTDGTVHSVTDNPVVIEPPVVVDVPLPDPVITV